jgi:hypothetical protein
LSVAAISADGNVLAIGDFTFLMSPYDQVADNGLLLQQVANFLVGGTRVPRLSTFPFSFNNDVHLITTGDVQFTADLMSAVSYLQSSLLSVGRQLAIDEKPVTKGDKIVLGTLTPSDELNPYLKPFKFTLDEFSSFVDLPGFGKVGKSGNGFLLFSTGADGTTLVLLTEFPEDIPTLINSIGGGNLSGCVLENQIGVCSIGFGSSFAEETPTAEPELTATPTP